MTSTIQEKVKCALENGKALTSATISNRYGAGNPGAVIQALRFAGTPVFLNKGPKGSKSKVYRTGKASKRVIGAGYKALAQGLIK
tara:strand:+ start:714 stop:968 length:255 start_codon:yes stop_codon:yes gene_type:complete